MIRILLFSTLFPNAAQPAHGIFVENRLRHLIASGEVQATVVAPVPWFPFGGAWAGRYGVFARVPREETRHGVRILHPRYLTIPGLGMYIAPFTIYLASRRAVRALLRQGVGFDLIDAHYFYPDGVAAALLARAFDRPLAITARGTDINLIPRYRLPRLMIRRAAARAFALAGVCKALADAMRELGLGDGEKIRVLRNGVDLVRFRPADRAAARQRLGLAKPTLISVGHLIDRKGHDIVIRALENLGGFDLLIAGEGERRDDLERLARDLGVAGRVRFLGQVSQDALVELYNAADILVLASSREGWANVLLEAMACGTPVVASNVWGTPEVVAAPEAGRLMAERTPEALAEAVRALSAALPDRAATRAYAEGFSWDATTRGQIEMFRAGLSEAGGAE